MRAVSGSPFRLPDQVSPLKQAAAMPTLDQHQSLALVCKDRWMTDVVVLPQLSLKLLLGELRREPRQLHPETARQVEGGRQIVSPPLHSGIEDKEITGLQLREIPFGRRGIPIRKRFKLRIDMHCLRGHPPSAALWKVLDEGSALPTVRIAVCARVQSRGVWYRDKFECPLSEQRAVDSPATCV
jgi:hypothetical protein